MTEQHRAVALTLPSPGATADLARALGQMLQAGDVLLLSGGIGAGKTHFARALIQSLLTVAEDVPSPTFTLVQEYETERGPLWHSDLYRLNGTAEIEELGLLDAFSQAICLVEWPDRLGGLTPDTALHLAFQTDPDTGPDTATDEDSRRVTLRWTDPSWDSRISDAREAVFLAQAGWAAARPQPLAGDASSRQYTRLHRQDETAILMRDPDGDTALFARLARHLTGLGLSAPGILAQTTGMLLIEDLGDGLIARLASDPQAERRLYLAATDTLVALHGHPAPAALPVATPEHLAQAIDVAFRVYADRPDLLSAACDRFTPILTAHAAPQGVMVLRDFHGENLLQLPGRTGAARTGLLDFQDALSGHPAYDLVSLCRDVRRDVAADTEAACIAAYIAATGCDAQAFHAAYAVLGVQRNLRILGVFARLALERGKTRYLEFLPRCWGHLQAQMDHPALGPMREIVAQLPAPDAGVIRHLRSRCPQ